MTKAQVCVRPPCVCIVMYRASSGPSRRYLSLAKSAAHPTAPESHVATRKKNAHAPLRLRHATKGTAMQMLHARRRERIASYGTNAAPHRRGEAASQEPASRARNNAPASFDAGTWRTPARSAHACTRTLHTLQTGCSPYSPLHAVCDVPGKRPCHRHATYADPAHSLRT